MRIVYRLFIQFISKYIDIILPIAQDVEFVLKNYCLISSEKMKKYSLAVNTDIFYCIESKDQRVGFRNHHGYVDDDIVCLYTGRFTDDKCPLLLAKAIHYLQSLGYSKYKGCFVGDGDVKYKECIRSFGACSVFSFADQNKLCLYYNYFDIGVWPAQESTSQLDAAACGMPIVVSSALSDDFRVNGNGLKFASGDYKGLADALLMLYSPVVRSEMGRIGVQKMSNHYSWHHNAELIIEYINALP